ncbi:hypothetical protein P879_01267 [Paragonimus westermani]|uniref:Uncharacterized protein n=1 Tax=Paragonimus westermani TaxID=34504 RepID=A0A8T0DT40_9TREM|nr:hypothetical protein P879_01267 [Paragonimus westermani]
MILNGLHRSSTENRMSDQLRTQEDATEIRLDGPHRQSEEYRIASQLWTQEAVTGIRLSDPHRLLSVNNRTHVSSSEAYSIEGCGRIGL